MVTGEILRVHPAPETLWLLNSLHVTALAPAAALNFHECGLATVVTHRISLGMARPIGRHVFSPGSTGCLTNNGAPAPGVPGKSWEIFALLARRIVRANNEGEITATLAQVDV